MIAPLAGRLVCADTGQLLFSELHVARNWFTRFVGLQGVASLGSQQALLLHNCRSIHTFWMRFPIDVVYLDDELRVVEVRRQLRPWRVGIPKSKQVRHILECEASQLEWTPGSLLRIENIEN